MKGIYAAAQQKQVAPSGLNNAGVQQKKAVNENEDLFQALELRYGAGFAQWILDGMKTGLI